MPDDAPYGDANTRYWWTVGPDGWTIETWRGDPSPENVVTVGRVADYESAEALVKELADHDLRPAVAQAIADLDAEHYPDDVLGGISGCVTCWRARRIWPCVTRRVADDLRAVLGEGA